MACKHLVEQYAQEVQVSIPYQGTEKEREDFLLLSGWGCKIPLVYINSDSTKQQASCEADGGQIVQDGPNTFCFIKEDMNLPEAQRKCLTAGGSEWYNSRNKDANNPNGAPEPLPVYNHYYNEGFLAWLNERGMKCIGQITGQFFGLNADGVINIPTSQIPFPDSKCWGACHNVTEDSEMCFECVKQELTNNPSLCPNVDLTRYPTLVEDCVHCQTCIASQANPKTMDGNKLWRCIDGTVPTKFTTNDIILVVLGTILLISIIVFAVLFVHFKHRTLTKREQHYLGRDLLDPIPPFHSH